MKKIIRLYFFLSVAVANNTMLAQQSIHNPGNVFKEHSELRFFLASNTDHLNDDGSFGKEHSELTTTSDLRNNWENKRGAPTKSGTFYTLEWHIPQRVSFINNEYLLTNLQYNNPSVTGPNAALMICDFIYRIDGNDFALCPTGTNEHTALFSLEYSVTYKDDNGLVHTIEIPNDSSDIITYSKMLHPVYPPNEDKDITSFPNLSKYQPSIRQTGSAKNYMVQRKVIEVSSMGLQSDYSIDHLECKLKAYHPQANNHPLVALYVRGLRIRSFIAE